MRSTTCRTPGCAQATTATPAWRRIFRWPLFTALAVVHLAVLPLVLGDRRDQVIAMLGGVAYLLLAALDRRSRPHRSVYSE
jgi:hypothetical protein